MKKIVFIFVSTILLWGCATSGYVQFYKPYINPKDNPDYEQLKYGERPIIYKSNALIKDVNFLLSKGYAVIGESNFNGVYENIQNAIDQARDVGATCVIVKANYSYTQTRSWTEAVPDFSTTYHSGNISTGRSNAYYNGRSTTYGTKYVEQTARVDRYDQNAVYLVKSNKKLRIGIYFKDLTPEKRLEIGRNTGVSVNAVVENSPAFLANVMSEDVITAVDWKPVNNCEELNKILDQLKSGVTFTLIRNKQTKNIFIKFNQ